MPVVVGRSGRAAQTVLLALLLLFAARPAVALDPGEPVRRLLVDRWSTAGGLPQDSVNAILQTRDGYLWAATEEGLARFDGVRFEVFDSSTTPELPSSNVLSLCEGRDGSLWIGTDRGLVRRTRGLFSSLGKSAGHPGSAITTMAEDAGGTLWVGSDDGTLTLLRNGRFEPAPGSAETRGKGVRAILSGRDGSMWVGTRGGLLRVRGSEVSRFTGAEGLPHEYVTSLAQTREGDVWIGTNGGGLARLRDGKFSRYGPKEGLTVETVLALKEDREGSLWVGTNGGGLCRLADERFECRRVEDGLPSNLVSALAEDREGGLWVGMNGGGLARLRESRFLTLAAEDGLAGDIALAIFQDREGSVWVGSAGAGLTRIRGGEFRKFTKRDGLPHEVVLSLAGDASGNVWIGTAGGGLTRFDGKTFETLTLQSGLSSNLVHAILSSRDGSLWVGTNGGGLCRLREGVFAVFGKGEGLGSEIVISLLEDREGTLWIGTRGGGLWRYRKGTISSEGLEAFAGQTVLALHEGADGTVWVGTMDAGLGRVRDGKVGTVRKRNGLSENLAGSLLEDADGFLWIGSNKGIDRVRVKALDDFLDGRAASVTPVHYGTEDGMRSAECNGGFQPAGWRTTDGRLWFPTARGVAIVDPKKLHDNPVAPTVLVESVLVNGSPADPERVVEVPAGGRSLEIRFTALSFVAPQSLRFLYRLDGLDADWVDAGRRRTAYYTHIPPGTYRFRVRGCNSDGLWAESGAATEFRVAARFHETPAFYAVCILVAAGAGFGVSRLRLRRMRLRELELQASEARLERIVGERTAELEAANRDLDAFARSVSHDLRSPLRAVDGYSAMLLQRQGERLDDDGRRLLGIVRKNVASMSRLVEDLLRFSRLGRQELSRGPVDMTALARAVFEETVAGDPDAASVDFVLEPLPEAFADEPLVRQVWVNLLSNALKFTAGRQRRIVKVSGVREGDLCRFVVEDNGAGFDMAHAGRLFKAFERLHGAREFEGTGVGLALAERIVRRHGGEIRGEGAVGRGATFSFTLPSGPGPGRGSASC